jgi:hypothetical protein
VQHGDRRLEPRADSLDQLWGERDLGHQDEDAQVAGQCLLCGGEIHLGLAAGDDAVEKRDLVGADHLERRLLLGGELHALHPRRRPGGQVDQARVPALPGGLTRPGRARGANPRRQHRSQALDEREPVVVGHQARQSDLVRQEHGLRTRCGDGLHLHSRVVLGVELHDEPVRGAAAERNRHPMARHDVHAFRHRVRVRLAAGPSRRLDGHLGVEH